MKIGIQQQQFEATRIYRENKQLMHGKPELSLSTALKTLRKQSFFISIHKHGWESRPPEYMQWIWWEENWW